MQNKPRKRFDAEYNGDIEEECWSATVTGEETKGNFTVNIPSSAALGRYSGKVRNNKTILL